MTARAPRFEVVHGDAGWFSRFRAAGNSRKVWQTEVYGRPLAAFHAIALIAGNEVRGYDHGFEVKSFALAPETGLLEVRVLDERAAVTS